MSDIKKRRSSRRRNGLVKQHQSLDHNGPVVANGQVEVDEISKVHTPLIDPSTVKYSRADSKESDKSSMGVHKLPQDIPMEERLRKINASKRNVDLNENSLHESSSAIAGTSKSLSTTGGGSMVVLLTQALHSDDKQKLDTVLNSSDKRLITQTLIDLPVPLLIPLLKQLETRLRTKTVMDIRPWICWVQLALSMHMPYLSSLNSLESQLNGLYTWMMDRRDQMQQLFALHGKLVLITDQFDKRENPQCYAAKTAASVVFNDDSSSDSELDENDEDNDEASGMDGQASGPISDEDVDFDWWDDEDEGSESGGENPDESHDSDSSLADRRRRHSSSTEPGNDDDDDDDEDGNEMDTD